MLLGFLLYVLLALFKAICCVAVPQSLGPFSKGLAGWTIVSVLLDVGIVVVAVEEVFILVMVLYCASLSLVLLFLLVVGVAFLVGLVMIGILSLKVFLSLFLLAGWSVIILLLVVGIMVVGVTTNWIGEGIFFTNGRLGYWCELSLLL